MKKPRSYEEFTQLKAKAINLEQCISNSLQTPPDMDDKKWVVLRERPAAEMALACGKLLGYR